jgi:hypothetical protein
VGTSTKHGGNTDGVDGVLCNCTVTVQPNEFEYIMLERSWEYDARTGSSIFVERRVYPLERRVDYNSRFGL